MIIVLVASAVLSATLPQILAVSLSIDQRFLDAHNFCTAITGIPQDMVEKAFDAQFPEVPPHFQEHLACFARQLNFLNDAGDVQIDNIRKMLFEFRYEEDFVDELIALCNQTQDTPAETAIHLAKCFFSNLRMKRKYT